MNLSPEQKQKVISAMAGLLVEELRADLGGSFVSLYCVPLAIAEKMTGLNRKTIQAKLPIVELSAGKFGVRLSDLNAYMEKKTRRPLAGKVGA